MELLDVINEVEKRFPVNEWRVDDVDIWPWVRISLAKENTTIMDTYQEKNRNSFLKNVLSQTKMLMSSIYASLLDYNHSDRIHSADVVFFSSNVTRTVRFPCKQLACQNVDAVKILLTKNNVSVYAMENIDSLPVKYPRYTNSDLMISWNIFKIKLKSKFKKSDSKVFVPDFEEVKNYLQDNGFIYTCLDKDIIKHTGYSIKILADYFYKVLVATGAKAGAVVCWYTYTQMAFLKACRMADIPGIDIQHGLAGANGVVEYVRWYNISEKGFNTMPTHFWCWTDKDKKSINLWLENSKNNNHAFLGGNPLELLCSLGEIRKEWLEKLSLVVDKNQKRVLLSLQTGFALPEFVIECISKTEGKVQWFIRCHPAFDKVQEEFLNLVKQYSNVEVEVATSCPLPILFDVIQFHVTSHSAVVNDAIRHGIKSALISDLGVNYFRKQILAGDSFLASNSVELMSLIDKYYFDDNCVRSTYTQNGVHEIIKLLQ